jgi:hypothetical protein
MQNGAGYEADGEHDAPTSGNFQCSQESPLHQMPTLSADQKQKKKTDRSSYIQVT